MPGKLYNQMNGQQPQNGPTNFFQALSQIKSMVGNPEQMIQQLLSSGRVSQEQYNTAVQEAEKYRKFFGG